MHSIAIVCFFVVASGEVPGSSVISAEEYCQAHPLSDAGCAFVQQIPYITKAYIKIATSREGQALGVPEHQRPSTEHLLSTGVSRALLQATSPFSPVLRQLSWQYTYVRSSIRHSVLVTVALVAAVAGIVAAILRSVLLPHTQTPEHADPTEPMDGKHQKVTVPSIGTGFPSSFSFVAIGFAFLGIIGCCCLVISYLDGDYLGFFISGLLVLAGFLAALASLAHAGLAKQVTQCAKQNSKFEAHNAKLAHQICQLQGTKERLVRRVGESAQNVDLLKDVVGGLNRASNLAQANVMICAFVNADLDGDADRRLRGEIELNDFFSACKKIIEKQLPDFDIDDLWKAAMNVGLNYACLGLIISAVLRCSRDPKRDVSSVARGHRAAMAFLSLVAFYLQPNDEDCIEDCVERLTKAFHMHCSSEYSSEAKLRQALHEFSQPSTEASEKTLPEVRLAQDKVFRSLASAAQHIRPWPSVEMVQEPEGLI